MKRLIPMILACCLVACTENPTSVAEGESSECGVSGMPTEVPTGERLCVYRPEIVIETGFRCPLALTNQFDFRNFSACSGRRQLPQIDLDFLHRNFDVPSSEPWLPPVEQPGALDILWVIDNTGSFCQEQDEIREGFSAFARELAGQEIDFHVAITTTHMRENGGSEPVAQPGHIQSTPQPIPGFDDFCLRSMDENGNAMPSDFAPTRAAISLAVGCMAEPRPEQFEFTDAEIACVLESRPDCSLASKPECGDRCKIEDLFPAPDSYRTIPKVLRASDYRAANGSIDLEALEADFTCASMVGTRGYGIERGLDAAVAAVSPELSGGSVEAPQDASAPNHGFLRDDARLAVLFASDENDCSHDGTLDEQTYCGGAMCEFAASPDYPGDSPLISIPSLRNQLIQSVSESKERTVRPGEIYIANFVGRAVPYTGPAYTNDDCALDEDVLPAPACASSSGKAHSGDRYESFARSFPLSNVFPRADYTAPDTPLEGLICLEKGISGEMPALATFLSEAAN